MALLESLGAAAGDIGAYFGAEAKAGFDISEGQEYDLAAQLARTNEQYTKMATGIKEAQADREAALSIGRTHAEVAGAGFSESGSALDILRSAGSQAALQHGAIAEQGLITEAGYEEQAQSYSIMAGAAREAAKAEKTAGVMDLVAAGFSVLGGTASAMPGSDGTINIPPGVGGDFVGA